MDSAEENLILKNTFWSVPGIRLQEIERVVTPTISIANGT